MSSISKIFTGASLGAIVGFTPLVYSVINYFNNPHFSRDLIESHQRMESSLNLLKRDRNNLARPNSKMPEYIPLDVRNEIEQVYGSDVERLNKITALDKAIHSVERDIKSDRDFAKFEEWNNSHFTTTSHEYIVPLSGLSFALFTLLGIYAGCMWDRKSFINDKNNSISQSTK